jgi:branched-chain amino acid transport system substrate-binding protein
MLGPSTGAIAGASGQAANQLKLPMYTVTNLVAALEAGPWAFIQTQPAAVAIPNAADFMVSQLKVKSCAAAELLDNESYVQQRKLFEQLVQARGVKTGAVAAIKLSDTDFSAVAVKIVDQQPDCLFVALPAVAAANFITQLRQAGLDPATKILGMTTLASTELITIGGPAVEGVYALSDWVPGGADAEGRAFSAAFKQRFGRDPDIWAAEGFSMVAVLGAALKATGPNPARESLRDAMARTRDVKVVVGTGTYSFDANRIPSYGNDILVVSKGSFVPVPR